MPLKIWSLLAGASIALPSITVLFSGLLLPFPGWLRAAGWCWWSGTRLGTGVWGHRACGAGTGASQERGDVGTLATCCSPGLQGMLPSQQQPPLSPN